MLFVSESDQNFMNLAVKSHVGRNEVVCWGVSASVAGGTTAILCEYHTLITSLHKSANP
jgi:hypothetical protein